MIKSSPVLRYGEHSLTKLVLDEGSRQLAEIPLALGMIFVIEHNLSVYAYSWVVGF